MSPARSTFDGSFLFTPSRTVFCFKSGTFFCCHETKSEQLATLLLFLIKPFFASMKQKRDLFCCDEATSGFLVESGHVALREAGGWNDSNLRRILSGIQNVNP
jgi:hypothetical protein